MIHFVRQSGAVLSSLFYECANSHTDLEGFLLGTLATRTLGAIDDHSGQTDDTTERFIVIQGYSLCQDRFYDSQGQVNRDAIEQQVRDIHQVVGYFRFRRETVMTLSIREQILMQGLQEMVPNLGCMAIITASLVEENDASTHAHDITFWNTTKTRIPLQIVNMNESTLAYQHFIPSVAQDPRRMDMLQSIDPTSIMQQYDTIYQRAMDALERATTQVIEKERELKALMEQCSS